MTPFSNIDNISYDTTKTEHAWKPCIKYLIIFLNTIIITIKNAHTSIHRSKNTDKYVCVWLLSKITNIKMIFFFVI